MEMFTPLHAITYAITKSMENLHFDKEDYFNVLVLYTGYSIKEIENIFPQERYVRRRLSFETSNLKDIGNKK